MRVHEATTKKKNSGKQQPYEIGKPHTRAHTREDSPPKHNFCVELKDLIAIPNIATRLNTPPQTEKKLGPSKNAWCEFHQAYDHAIHNCLSLGYQLDKLVKNDFLKEYLLEPQGDQVLAAMEVDQGSEVPIHGEINTISGGFSRTASQRKKYAREVMAVEVHEADQTPYVDLVFTKADH